MSNQPPPKPDDCVAWITVRLHAHGAMSIHGTIGDRKLAHKMLDHARDAITRQIPDVGIVVPNHDVEIVPASTLKEIGDIPPSQRGDA